MDARTPSIPTGSVAELANQLLLSRADDGDQENPRGRAVFWVGAGASISAGIPSGRALAGRLAHRIAIKLGFVTGHLDDDDPATHEISFAALQGKGIVDRSLNLGSAYGALFEKLDNTLQRDFIRKVISKTNNRQTNWTHLAIGELVSQRIVHSVLTTNFDDLLLDGLVRSDELPAIIDGIESLNRLDPRPPVPQLVYLHGSQHTYRLRNGTAAVGGTRESTSARGGLYSLLRSCSVLVVVGYAGNAGEGVMELLVEASKDLPDLQIFWIAYGNHDSLSEMPRTLLSGGSNKRLIAGQDSDLFFKNLLSEAGIGTPKWLDKPVHHLINQARRIRVATDDKSADLLDVVQAFRDGLEQLLPCWERVEGDMSEISEIQKLALRNDQSAIWARLRERSIRGQLLRLRAEAAFELGCSGIESTLPQAVTDWVDLLTQLSAGTPEWAAAQNKLGNTLSVLGNRQGDVQKLREAVKAYVEALNIRTSQSLPSDWAATKTNLGITLAVLGQQGNPSDLKEAIKAFSDALQVWTRDSFPEEWAKTKSNLGGALLSLATLGDTDALDSAIQSFEEALQERRRDIAPIQWSKTQINLGTALRLRGVKSGDGDALVRAIAAFRSAMEVLTRTVDPVNWAAAQLNLGSALLDLGERTTDDQLISGAIDAFKAALQVYTRDATPLPWATAMNNLGNGLLYLGQRGNAEAAEGAAECYRAAILTQPRDSVPMDWALTRMNLGLALLLAEQKDLDEAVAAQNDALEVFASANAQNSWAQAQNNLGLALSLVGETRNDPESLRQAARAYREALSVRTSENEPLNRAQTLLNLGRTLANLGERGDREAQKDAEISFREAFDLASRHGHRDLIVASEAALKGLLKD